MNSPDDYWYVTQRAREADELSRAHIQRRGTGSGIGRPVIEGIYHPHLVDGPGTYPVDAGIEALGQTYLTAIAGFLAEVSLPRLDMAHKTLGPLAPPRFEAYGEDFNWSDAIFPHEPDWPKWGKNRGSGRVTIREFRLAVDPGEESSKDVSEAVQGAIGEWWRLAKAWIEILTSQDLEGADQFHWSTGSLHLLYRDDPSSAWRSEPGRVVAPSLLATRHGLRCEWPTIVGIPCCGLRPLPTARVAATP